jgi:hypothetical protein
MQMPNSTTNYSFNLPLVNNATDADLWGGQLNSNWTSLDTTLFAFQLPVGSIYTNKTDSTNPATLLGYGTWTALTDVFLVSRGGTYTGTGGAATDSITIATANLPSTITLTDTGCGDLDNNVTGGSFLAGVASASDTRSVTVSTGGSGSAISVDTLPPYQAVYTWERTA